MRKLSVFCSFALLTVFVVPVEAKVKIGGIIFTDFYYLDRDKENAYWWWVGDGNTSYGNTALQLPNISRIYAKWTNEDNVGMRIELGIGQYYGSTESSKSDGVMLRHAYGWWDISPDFRLMVGKSTTPFSQLNPSQLLGSRSRSLNLIGLGYGNYYSGRFAQIRGTYKFSDNARIAVALVDPNGSQRHHGKWYNYFPYGQTDYEYGLDYTTSTKLPRIDISTPMYFGGLSLYPSFLFQRRTVDKFNSEIASP